MPSSMNQASVRDVVPRLITASACILLAATGLAGQVEFGAYYTSFNTGREREAYSRTGPFTDIVVRLAQPAGQLVFWRGNGYLPFWKTEKGQWDLAEIVERSGDGTKPMPDRVNAYSHAEVVENDSRGVLIRWRYLASFTAGNPHRNVSPNNFVEELFAIQPDGAVERIIRRGTEKIDAWNDSLNRTTQRLKLGLDGVAELSRTLSRRSPPPAKVTPLDWNPEPPKPTYKGNFIQMIRFTGKYSPFAIQNFIGGRVYRGERTWYSVFPSWNHWPTAQADSSGRNCSFTDRASHSSLSEVFFAPNAQQKGRVPFEEKLMMEGMTDLPPAALTNLAKSWLSAPLATNVVGGANLGYDQGRRAYAFQWTGQPLKFQIYASSTHPVQNVCSEIKNWPGRTAAAA